jgi:cytidylate kinase
MGRGAQVVLRDVPRVFHVRTVAPLPVRIGRVARDEGADEREAARRIRHRDRSAARYLRHFYRVDWGDPLLYHLVVNTATLTEAEAVRLILHAAPREDDLPAPPWAEVAGHPSALADGPPSPGIRQTQRSQ